MLSWLSKIRLWELALTVFLGFGCYFIWSSIQSEAKITSQASSLFTHANKVLDQTSATLSNVNDTVNKTGTSVSKAVGQIGGVASSAKSTLAIVNHPCSPGPCGTLFDFAKTMNTARLTLGQIEIAADHEDKNLGTLDKQETQLFLDTHSALSGFVPVQNDIDKTVLDADAFLKSPDLTGSIHNFNTISYNLGETTTDFQTKFHSFLYPPPCKGFKCYIKTGYETIKVGSSLAEPAYYFWAITSGVHP